MKPEALREALAAVQEKAGYAFSVGQLESSRGFPVTLASGAACRIAFSTGQDGINGTFTVENFPGDPDAGRDLLSAVLLAVGDDLEQEEAESWAGRICRGTASGTLSPIYEDEQYQVFVRPSREAGRQFELVASFLPGVWGKVDTGQYTAFDRQRFLRKDPAHQKVYLDGRVIGFEIRPDSYGTPFTHLTVETEDGYRYLLVLNRMNTPYEFATGENYRFYVHLRAARGCLIHQAVAKAAV